MKRYDHRRTKEIKSQLFKRERWNADTIMNLLHLLVEKEPSLDKTVVEVVDSGFLCRVIDSEQVTDHSLDVMRNYLRDSKLLLLPIFASEHWSLLAYLGEEKTWYHCDSMGEMHSERVNFILARLHLLGIFNGLDEEQKRVSFHTLLKNQEGRDECGTYLVMYAMAFIYNIRSFSSKEKFQSSLEGELSKIGEDKRHEFLQRLEVELSLIGHK